MPAKSWLRAWKKGGWIKRLCGRIFPASTASRGVESWIASLAASRARTLATPESEPESKESTPRSGSSSLESFAKWDQPSSSWRTSVLSLFWGSIEFSETWPPFGSMRNGACFQRPTPAPHTTENGSSFWATPVAHDARDTAAPSEFKRRSPGLHAQVIDFHRRASPRSGTRGVVPNPEFVEALMGWALGWTALEPVETESSHKQRPSHSEPSQLAS